MLLSVFAQAFKTPDLRRKIFFTLSIMALFRFGSVVPTPGVSYSTQTLCLRTWHHALHHCFHHRPTSHRRHSAI
jgi:preprotein translocase subunit SecY